jgi:hypothetical protein
MSDRDREVEDFRLQLPDLSLAAGAIRPGTRKRAGLCG